MIHATKLPLYRYVKKHLLTVIIIMLKIKLHQI